jgi:AraC-like DNA-binding protein
MDSNEPGRILFSTEALPERDRFPMVCEEFARRLLTVDCVNRSADPFEAMFDIHCVGRLAIAHINSSAADYVRTPEQIRDGQEFLFVTLPLQGAMFSSQTGSMERIDPGGGIILDSTHSGGVHFTGKVSYVTMRIARPQIAPHLARQTRLLGNRLDANPLARRLLIGYLEGTRNIDLSTNRSAALLYDEHLVDLIILALGGEGEAGNLARRRGMRAARLTAILRLVERRSGDPALSAAAIATALGVTPRYVHLLLEETGRSFTHHLLEKRLENAAALLRDPRWAARRIGDVALEAGFTDLSHFSRSFRRRYGVTPSDVREAAVRDRERRD